MVTWVDELDGAVNGQRGPRDDDVDHLTAYACVGEGAADDRRGELGRRQGNAGLGVNLPVGEDEGDVTQLLGGRDDCAGGVDVPGYAGRDLESEHLGDDVAGAAEPCGVGGGRGQRGHDVDGAHPG